MGSIGEALTPLADTAAHDFGAKLGSFVGKTKVGQEAVKAASTVANSSVGGMTSEIASKSPRIFRSMLAEFGKTEFGTLLRENVLDYRQTKATIVSEIGKRETNPAFVGPRRTSSQINQTAMNIASAQHFGRNNEIIAATLHGAKLEMAMKDPGAAESHVQNMADNLNVIMHDNREIKNLKGGTQLVSQLKTNTAQNPQFKKSLSFLNTDATYQPVGKTERFLHSAIYKSIVPWASLAHLGGFSHAAFSEPFGSFTSAALSMMKDYKGSVDFLHKTGIYEESVLSSVRQQVDYKAGLLNKFLPNTLAYYLNKATDMPLMQPVRNMEKTLFGLSGMKTAQEAAKTLVTDPTNARALFELRDMHLDVNEVRKQGGELTEEQLTKAIYHHVNNNVGLHVDMERSFYARQNPWSRMTTMFHSFVAFEGRFLSHQIYKASVLKGTDPFMTARSMAALTLVFPAFGLAIHQIRAMVGGDFSFADTKESLSAMNGSSDYEGQKKALEAYLELYSYVGGFGLLTSYSRALGRHRLLEQMAGPLPNNFFQLATDVYNMNTKAVGKDLLQDIPSAGLGRIAARKLFPTKAQQRKDKMKSLRMKGLKGLSMN